MQRTLIDSQIVKLAGLMNVVFAAKRNDRLGFHQQSRQKVEPGDRPEAGQNKQSHRNGPGPENREIKKLGKASANPQQDAMA